MHGFIAALYEEERLLAKGEGVWEALQELMDQAGELGDRIHALERGEIGKLNRAIDDLRLEERRLQREKNDAQLAANEVRRQALWDEHEALSGRLDELAGAAAALGGGGHAGRGRDAPRRRGGHRPRPIAPIR